MDAFDFLGFLKKINLYYFIKPLIPRRVQIHLRRFIVHRKKNYFKHVWPINEHSNKAPENWGGWPDQKKFALVLTHDVEGLKGVANCVQLAELEKSKGFISCFNFVPRRYDLDDTIRQHLVKNGFEIGVHGLYHDGKLYKSKRIFKKRAHVINQYLKKWGAVGFRAPSMHHQLKWNCLLDIEYDLSTFDTDPFEPQSDGIDSIFPIIVDACDFNDDEKLCSRYVELPYTLPQDFSLFILLKEKNINIWKRKLDWIADNNGMVLINTHPDYMNFGNSKNMIEEYSADFYSQFLDYISEKYAGEYWHALPRDVARFSRTNISTKKSL